MFLHVNQFRYFSCLFDPCKLSVLHGCWFPKTFKCVILRICIYKRMDLCCGHVNTALLITLLFVAAISVESLRCVRCSLDECRPNSGMEVVIECRPEHTDCATSILRYPLGNLRANSVFERYCYRASRHNKLYVPNAPHCQKNDRATVEVCVCQGDLCNEQLPQCRLRNYGSRIRGYEDTCRME